jgi:type II secretory pathway pseudopilin PulG
VFIAKSLTDKHLPILIRIILLSVSIFLFFASIVANVGLIQNNSNKTRNQEIRQSTEYQQAQEQYQRQQQLYQGKLDEISNTTTTYDATIEATKESLARSKAAWEINQHTNTLNKTLSEKTKRLEQLNTELDAIVVSPGNVDNVAFSSENGYSATFLFLAESRMIKWIFKGIDKDLLQYYYFISLSTVFELINMLSVYLFCMFLRKNHNLIARESPTPDPSPKQKIPAPDLKPKETPTPDLSPKLNLVKPNRTLGVKASKDFHLRKTPKNISDSDIAKYIKYMNETAVDGISQGYIKISKNIGLSQEKCRKIKGWLEQEGIIKSEGGRTVIVKNNIKGVG